MNRDADNRQQIYMIFLRGNCQRKVCREQNNIMFSNWNLLTCGMSMIYLNHKCYPSSLLRKIRNPLTP